MEANVGGLDRDLRIGVGGVLIVVGILSLAGVFATGGGSAMMALRVLVVLVGAILAVTGLTQTCLVNRARGVDTTK